MQARAWIESKEVEDRPMTQARGLGGWLSFPSEGGCCSLRVVNTQLMYELKRQPVEGFLQASAKGDVRVASANEMGGFQVKKGGTKRHAGRLGRRIR